MRNRRIYIISLLVVIIFVAGIVSFDKGIRQSASGLFMAGLLTILSPLTIKRIEFHAKIVDQYGDPIDGVAVEYHGFGSPLASGSGAGSTITDSEGLFSINGAKGDSLRITKLSKFGYHFPEVDVFYMPRAGEQKERYWSDYGNANPFSIKAWKLDRLSNVNHSPHYSLEILEKRSDVAIFFGSDAVTRLDGNQDDAHLIYNYNQGQNWRLELKSNAGGYIEASDYFMYEAPAEGYIPNIVLEGEGTDFDKQKFYFKSSNGQYYGSFEIEIRPGYGNVSPWLIFNYTVNLDGTRDLIAPKNYSNKTGI